MLLVRMKLVDS